MFGRIFININSQFTRFNNLQAYFGNSMFSNIVGKPFCHKVNDERWMQSSENGDSPQISKLTTFIKSGLTRFFPLLLFTGRELLLRDPIDKPARLIIRLLFGFASDLTNSNSETVMIRPLLMSLQNRSTISFYLFDKMNSLSVPL